MADLSMKRIHDMMTNQSNIRNISVIAHVDHGKSTLTDCLVIKAKLVGEGAAGGRYMDGRADEQERGITIKSTAISMSFALNENILKENLKDKQSYNGEQFLINLIDSPGHVDFNSEVTAALRVTDGALVVIDTIDGICVQTETVMRQAIAERIRPTVVLNKIDRSLLELNEEPVDLAAKLRRRVEDFNVKLEINSPSDAVTPVTLRPEDNEFSFCSGLQGWGFSLRNFARFYKNIFEEERKKRLAVLKNEKIKNKDLNNFVKIIIQLEDEIKKFITEQKSNESILKIINKLPSSVSKLIKTFYNKQLKSLLKKGIEYEGTSDAQLNNKLVDNIPKKIKYSEKEYKSEYIKIKRMANMENPYTEQQICEILWSPKIFYTGTCPFTDKGEFTQNESEGENPLIIFVLGPIYKVRDNIYKKRDNEFLCEYLKNFNISLDLEKLKKLNDKESFVYVMRQFLPAAETLLEQIILNLPSPVTSQKYRYDQLYTGPSDDQTAIAIRDAATENAPAVLYVSKMIPYGLNRFIAFGRVFSGIFKPGMKVRIQGPHYDHSVNSKNDLSNKSIQRIVCMMGRQVNDIPSCPAGNIIGIIGIDNELKKTGTIASEPCYNIKDMKFSVSPVVKIAIKPKKATDLQKLAEGLDRLSKSDPLVVTEQTQNGEMTLAGAGELHLEIALNDLKDYAKCEIICNEPLVTYQEGISGVVEKSKMAKSPNKHNRIFCGSEPMEEDLIEAIENGLVERNQKTRVMKYREAGFGGEWVKKLLFYGPDDNGPNIVVDQTKGVDYLNEIVEHMKDGFRKVTVDGPLIGETVRGCRFNINDVVLHADAIHRGANQITPAFMAVIKGLILKSIPILYEPIFTAEVNVATDQISGVTSCLQSRRGSAQNFENKGQRTIITGYLPVEKSFGFNADLLKATKGQANAILSFSHYSILPGRLDDENSLMSQVIKKTRERKNLGELKKAEDYFDTL